MNLTIYRTEAEFLDLIWSKSKEFSSLLFTVTSTNGFYSPPPHPAWAKVVWNWFVIVNIVYGYLKSENFQGYAQKPQGNCLFMNLASVVEQKTERLECLYSTYAGSIGTMALLLQNTMLHILNTLKSGVPQCMSSRRNWDSPIPFLARLEKKLSTLPTVLSGYCWLLSCQNIERLREAFNREHLKAFALYCRVYYLLCS
jgi:hypothetical protein